MDLNPSLRQRLKFIRWRFRRALAARRWGADQLNRSPIVLANAMPKSGSHLIYQVVQGLSRLGPFVNPGFPPVNRDEFNAKLSDEYVLANLHRLHPGDTAYGYIKSRPPFTSLLTQPGWAMLFVFRDPRDMILSHVFYATQMHPGHGMHGYYTQTLKTMEERIDAAIEGVTEQGSELSPIYEKYRGYLGWLEQPAVLNLRFENLIHDRQRTLETILEYLESRGYVPSQSRPQQVESLQESIRPHKSGTFRKGGTGDWRAYFTESNKAHFKQLAGDLLIVLGYEKDNAW